MIEPVNVEDTQAEPRISLENAVDVDEGQNVARIGASGVSVDSLEVIG